MTERLNSISTLCRAYYYPIMTDKEMALRLARLILEFQMRVLALESEIDLYRVDGSPISWKEKVQRSTDELVKDEPFQKRVSELSSLFEQSTPGSLLETLYIGMFRKSPHSK